jgi:hypothetical protein
LAIEAIRAYLDVQIAEIKSALKEADAVTFASDQEVKEPFASP